MHDIHIIRELLVIDVADDVGLVLAGHIPQDRGVLPLREVLARRVAHLRMRLAGGGRLAILDDFLGHREKLLILPALPRAVHPLHEPVLLVRSHGAPLVQAGLLRPAYQVELGLGDPELDAVLLVLQVVQLGLLLRLRCGEALLLLLKPRQLLLLALLLREEVELEAVALAQLAG